MGNRRLTLSFNPKTTKTKTDMVNRYPGQCVQCQEYVPSGLGTVSKRGRAWRIDCNACTGRMPEDSGLVCIRTSSGWTGTRNARGRCEDAPCCGCCTF